MHSACHNLPTLTILETEHLTVQAQLYRQDLEVQVFMSANQRSGKVCYDHFFLTLNPQFSCIRLILTRTNNVIYI